MLPGFNHNVRYKDKVFHVQTEDGGQAHPQLLSQLFIGGRLLALECSSYAELLSRDGKTWSAEVLQRMQAQHKRLLKALIAGAFDAKIAAHLEETEKPLVVPPSRSSPVPSMTSSAVTHSSPSDPALSPRPTVSASNTGPNDGSRTRRPLQRPSVGLEAQPTREGEPGTLTETFEPSLDAVILGYLSEVPE